jgi:hypothetical protein
VTSLFNSDELSSRVAREQHAAAQAKCENSRRAHLGLAEQYRQKLALVEGIKSSIRINFG